MRGVAESGDAGGVVLLSLGVGRPEIGGNVRNLHIGTIKNDRLLSLIYSAADVYVIASLQESFGQTVIESMACGTPVVGFASGGIVDMVRPGISGYLAPTGDAGALRDAVLRALRDDPAVRLRDGGKLPNDCDRGIRARGAVEAIRGALRENHDAPF